MEETNKLTKKNKTTLIVGIVLFLILILSASYAYFQITSVNNATTTIVTGTGEVVGTPTLTTNTPNMGINLTAEMMSKEKIDYRYYATPDNQGIGYLEYDEETYEDIDFDKVLTVGNGRYELATATLDKGVPLDCTFSYDISATTTKDLGSSSAADVKVILTDSNGIKTTYTLRQLINGITYTGKFNELTSGSPQKIYVESYVLNSSRAQDYLVGNTYTINITPKSGTTGFKCEVTLSERIKNKNVAEFIASNYNTIDNIWKSGYDSDGYRYVGTGRYNSADNPHNFVCFGTTDKTECTSNPDKYMYRIIGAFQEENGDGTINTSSPYHLKLLKKSIIGNYPWHSSSTTLTWENTDLYKGLNGSYFLTNTNYDYMQNNTWKNKIFDWNWTSVQVDTTESGNYYGGLWTQEQLKNNYLHELNRSSKVLTTGSWSYTTAKIGLMYASDYYLSNGSALVAYHNRWIHGYQNDELADTVVDTKHSDRYIASSNISGASFMGNANNVTIWNNIQTKDYGVRPAFYLDSNVQFSSGSGTYLNPFIIK